MSILSSRMEAHKENEISHREMKELHFLCTCKCAGSEFGIPLHLFPATQFYRKFSIISLLPSLKKWEKIQVPVSRVYNFKCTRQTSLYVFNKSLTLPLHRPYILHVRMCVWHIHVYILILSISFFLLHFLCAELGYLFFWMMQWVNKIIGRKSFKVQGPWHYSLFRFD